jgi:hypothetical protein
MLIWLIVGSQADVSVLDAEIAGGSGGDARERARTGRRHAEL